MIIIVIISIFEKYKFKIFLAYVTPRLPMNVHKKFQPIRSSRLAG